MTLSKAIETTAGVIAGTIAVIGIVAGLGLGVYLTMGVVDLCGPGVPCEGGFGIVIPVFGVWLVSFLTAAIIWFAGQLLRRLYERVVSKHKHQH